MLKSLKLTTVFVAYLAAALAISAVVAIPWFLIISGCFGSTTQAGPLESILLLAVMAAVPIAGIVWAIRNFRNYLAEASLSS